MIEFKAKNGRYTIERYNRLNVRVRYHYNSTHRFSTKDETAKVVGYYSKLKQALHEIVRLEIEDELLCKEIIELDKALDRIENRLVDSIKNVRNI